MASASTLLAALASLHCFVDALWISHAFCSLLRPALSLHRSPEEMDLHIASPFKHLSRGEPPSETTASLHCCGAASDFKAQSSKSCNLEFPYTNSLPFPFFPLASSIFERRSATSLNETESTATSWFSADHRVILSVCKVFERTLRIRSTASGIWVHVEHVTHSFKTLLC